jgi:hypothetical protein
MDSLTHDLATRAVRALESIDAKLPSAAPDPRLTDERIAEAREVVRDINSSIHGRAVETLNAALDAAEDRP